MMAIVAGVGILLALYCWTVAAMSLPRALFYAWWWIAQAITFVCLGFFIIKPFCNSDAASAVYNPVFKFCAAIVGIGVTAMMFSQ